MLELSNISISYGKSKVLGRPQVVTPDTAMELLWR